MHWSFSGQDTAPVMRQRGFESHPVLCRLIFNNSARNSRTHDVAAAYRLAKAEVRVQLPLGAFSFAWTVRRENEGPSAVNDYQRVGKHGNPRASGARERRFKSDHADLNHCGGVRAGTGRRLLIVTTQVRFLSPQLHDGSHPAG